MNPLGKFIATGVIWTAFLGVMVTVFLSEAAANMSSFGMVMIVAILALAAVIGTAAVNDQLGNEHKSPELAERMKPKRTEQGRIERLMQMMDEDDIVELEQVLKEREVEAIRRSDS